MEGDIQFKNVFLKYNKEYAPALLNLSFTVKEGESIGIVGHGGSGKSSILKLLMGMYSPLSGSILIDNINLKQIDIMRLRKSIAYVPSRNFQFSGSILSNLYLSRPDASDNQIRECLELTGADKIIESLERRVADAQGQIQIGLKKIERYRVLQERTIIYAPRNGTVHGLSGYGSGSVVKHYFNIYFYP